MIRPGSVEEACIARGEYRAGGTDVQARRRLGLSGGEMVDLRGVVGLAGIHAHDDGVRLGSMTRISALATDPTVLGRYPALALAAGSLATPQIRAVGTLGGNLLQRNRCPYYRHPGFSCHKSGGSTCPARQGDHRHGVIFDLGPCVSPHPSTLAMALMVYEAEVEVGGGRRITVASLMGDGRDGSHDHQLPQGEVLVAVEMPRMPEGERGSYRRATGRALAAWPIAEVVCRLAFHDSVIERASVAVGGVAPVPLRRPAVEEALAGLEVDDLDSQRRAAGLATDGATPLPSTGHKVDLLQNVVFDAIRLALTGEAHSEAAVGERPLPGGVERR